MINRNALRTALTAGLGNAFASLSGVEFSQYVALAVLAVSTGTYGGALALGRQRLLGTALGSVLLLIGYEGLRGVPMPLAIASTGSRASSPCTINSPQARSTGSASTARP